MVRSAEETCRDQGTCEDFSVKEAAPASAMMQVRSGDVHFTGLVVEPLVSYVSENEHKTLLFSMGLNTFSQDVFLRRSAANSEGPGARGPWCPFIPLFLLAPEALNEFETVQDFCQEIRYAAVACLRSHSPCNALLHFSFKI